MQNALNIIEPTVALKQVQQCVDDFDDQNLITVGDDDEIKHRLLNLINVVYQTHSTVTVLQLQRSYAQLRAQLWVDSRLSYSSRATLARMISQLIYQLDVTN